MAPAHTPDDGRPEPSQPGQSSHAPLHEASRLLRRVLVLNDAVEYLARTQLETNDTDLQAMQILMNQGELTPTQLSEQLHLSAAATTTVIDRLVRRKHAERVPHPADRRRILIRPLPAAAEKVMNVIWPMILRTDEVVHDMSAPEQTAVTDYLRGVVAAMETFIDTVPDQATGS